MKKKNQNFRNFYISDPIFSRDQSLRQIAITLLVGGSSSSPGVYYTFANLWNSSWILLGTAICSNKSQKAGFTQEGGQPQNSSMASLTIFFKKKNRLQRRFENVLVENNSYWCMFWYLTPWLQDFSPQGQFLSFFKVHLF